MSNLLPVELITYILCRVAVKSLLRFRCVSKQWCYLIDSQYFIKLNLNHSLKTNTNLSLILSHKKEGIFSVEFDTLNTAIKINNPIDEGGRITYVLGSCNGLVALLTSPKYLALLNPSTRKYHKLPVEPYLITGGFSKPRAYGFGYDPVSDDYKLVRVCKDQVKVYSLKSNSWRETRGFPYYQYYCPRGNGILANNALHWVVSRKPETDSENLIESRKPERDSANLIVAFDLRVEEYFEVPQPDYMDTINEICVDSLGDCLCVVCDYDNVGADIWVMKEYGVKESWIKLFSMGQTDVIVNLLAYSKSGDRVLFDQADDDDDEHFVWYDLRRKRAEEVRIQGAPKSYEVEMCVGSLVPLSGGGGTNATKEQAPVKKEEEG